jgi:hypothetical protein
MAYFGSLGVLFRRVANTIGDPRPSSPNLLSIDYFSQDDVWSAQMVLAGYPLNSTAVHLNGQSYDNKVLRFNMAVGLVLFKKFARDA